MNKRRRRKPYSCRSFERFLQFALFACILVVVWIKYSSPRTRGIVPDSVELPDALIKEKLERVDGGTILYGSLGMQATKYEHGLPMPQPFSDPVNVVIHNSASSFRWKKTMGFTGESLQNENILEALKILNVTVHIVDYGLSNFASFRKICSLALEGKIDRIDALIVSGADRANYFAKNTDKEPFFKPNQILLLDDFGRIPSGQIPPSHVLSWQPMPKNTFLGCYLDLEKERKLLVDKNIERLEEGMIWGKHDDYFPFQTKRMLVDVSKRYKLHTSSRSSVFNGFDARNIKHHGKMPRTQYHQLMKSMTFFVGLGDPLVAPSAIEAMFQGVTVILPIYAKPRVINGQAHRSQYDQLLFDFPAKYPKTFRHCVCGYEQGSTSSLNKCIDLAIKWAREDDSRECSVPEFSKTAFVKRLKSAIDMALMDVL